MDNLIPLLLLLLTLLTLLLLTTTTTAITIIFVFQSLQCKNRVVYCELLIKKKKKSNLTDT